ncbi:MAG: hypothetical protein M1816_000197 [Peltula sp. TS41687]|nr:MAG: hypothetical protein M1816_000197 [Peltula sp. TS41687]
MSNLRLAELDNFYQGPRASSQVSRNNNLPTVKQATRNNNSTNGVEVLFDATTIDNDDHNNEEEEEFGDFETAAEDAVYDDGVRSGYYTTNDRDTSTTSIPSSSKTIPPMAKKQEIEDQLLDPGLENGTQPPMATEEISDSHMLGGRNTQRPTMQTIDLLSSADTCNPAPLSPRGHVQQHNDIDTQEEEEQEEEEEDEWGDFVDSHHEPHAPSSMRSTSTSQTDTTYAKTMAVVQSSPSPSAPPSTHLPSPSSAPQKSLPTTIPPPSQLLPLFHDLLLPTAPTSTTTSHPNINPSTILVLAHILSGRALRWKRDVYLSSAHTLTLVSNTSNNNNNNTSNYPRRQQQQQPSSSSSAGKGLKLHSLTTNEHLHEAREVAEVLALWRRNQGRVRAGIVAAAGGTAGTAGTGSTGTTSEGGTAGRSGGNDRMPALPELREHMAVTKVGMAQGGIKSTRACLLCGLLREERVGGVHCVVVVAAVGGGEGGGRGGGGGGEGKGMVRVEDSFGEWWVEERGWVGHVVCWEWWEGMRGELLRR